MHLVQSPLSDATAVFMCTLFGAPLAAARCQLVGAFKSECYGIAMDPKAGTPGAGWAIAATKTMAEQRAIDNCKETAGSDRREFCEVAEAKCDDVKK